MPPFPSAFFWLSNSVLDKNVVPVEKKSLLVQRIKISGLEEDLTFQLGSGSHLDKRPPLRKQALLKPC